MKGQFLSILTSLISSFIFSQVQVFPEVHFEHDGENSGIPAGYTTYRIYCYSNQEGFSASEFSAINTQYDLYIQANNDIYQHPDGQAFPTSAIDVSLYPDLEFDSYLTISNTYDWEYDGFFNFWSILPGDAYESFEQGNDLFLEDGVWFTIPGSPNSIGDGSGKILIAQITTSSDLSYMLNIRGRYISDEDETIDYELISSPEGEITDEAYAIGLAYPAPEGTAIIGCTDPEAFNYNPIANVDDGMCFSAFGCTDPTACNYAAEALVDDGSCILPDGCTDPEAVNYNFQAICDDGSCFYFLPEFQIYHEVYAEHEGTVEGIPENYTTYRIYLDFEDPSHKLLGILGSDEVGPIYIQANNDILQHPFGSILPPGWCDVFEAEPALEFDSFISLNKDCNSTSGIVSYFADNPEQAFDSFEEGNDLLISDGSWYAEPDEPNVLQEEGKFLLAQVTTSGSLGYSFNFEMLIQGNIENNVVYSAYLNGDSNSPAPYAYDRGMIYPDPNAVYGCTNPNACNFDSLANTNDGSCILPDGCTNPLAVNYNPAALCDDGSCIVNEGEGCSVEFIPEVVSSAPPVMNVAVDFSGLEEFDHYWSFGDGSISVELYPMHYYIEDGSYELCLSVSTQVPGEPDCSHLYCSTVSSDDFPQVTSGGDSEVQSMNGFTINIFDASVNILESFETEVKIFPNPGRDLVFIELKEGLWDMKIYSSTGILVRNKSKIQQRELINVQSWPSGMYIVHLSNLNGEQKSIRFTVN